MSPKRIKAIRHRLGESTEVFGRRFLKSGRTVEDWEQGRRHPDPFIAAAIKALGQSVGR